MAKTPNVIKRKCFLAYWCWWLRLTLLPDTNTPNTPTSPPTPVSGTGSAGAKMASDKSQCAPPLLVSSATSDETGTDQSIPMAPQLTEDAQCCLQALYT